MRTPIESVTSIRAEIAAVAAIYAARRLAMAGSEN
jgi:hypothetical protein